MMLSKSMSEKDCRLFFNSLPSSNMNVGPLLRV